MSLKFIEVKETPNRTCYNHLRTDLKEFMGMNIKVAKIESSEHYKNTNAAACSLRKAIRIGGWPITVARRKDEVYLIRRDM